MSNLQNDPLLQVETTCGSLLYELQIIWDEVGELDADRDKMLLELEQECLEVYRRKVDQANRNRAQLRQAIADSEAELAAICSAMGERPVHIRQFVLFQADKNAGSLKEELQRILPQLEDMRKRKLDRRNQFVEVLDEIQQISNEIYGSAAHIFVDETDLSLKKLEELHRQLHALQKEKSDRLKKVQEHLDTLNSLCVVLGMDFKHTVTKIHPSFCDTEGSRSINTDTIQHLATAILKLREIKIQRMQKLQDLATTMLELWNLMDTPIEEQQMFQNVTCNIAASEHEITEPNTLSVDFINYVEAEVCRLEELKSSKMKDLVLKKRSELEEVCRKTHMAPEEDTAMEYAIEAIGSDNVDPASVLEQIELQIAKVKEEAFCRKEILEKIEKWLAACDEECWLEGYNRDENRYNAGRGTHLTLKRAEKARSLVNKLPGMVEALASKTMAWEKERGIEFLYDGIRLLSMLEEYTILRQEKEEERQRQRDQKKLQGQLIAEQEALYGSKPSPSKTQNVRKAPRVSAGGASNRRLSLGGAMLQTPKPDLTNTSKATQHSHPGKKVDRFHQYDPLNKLHDDSFATLSAGRRGSDIAGLPAKIRSFNTVNAHEPESPMLRKPFSPISSTGSSKANVLEDVTAAHTDTTKKTLGINELSFLATTPLKTCVADEENRTPRVMPIPVSTPPSTLSVSMQTAMTPAPPLSYGASAAEEVPEEIEYSFEERRAGFVLPRTPIKSTQV
ncbi:65-kDa microtubule-associated protein 3 isoform X2 [Hevea brasiliensis]|uniref:65-kDa microtubule-associated protein 3 isoform X2 n=1 Tax=Hevea brasiliensis TaxID=3981 RepID=UPI000B77EFC3|nr:65-kDa microtubule-associated protein 3 isoform X2 [Hevea brasiliensis]